jgi:hypothetical protein
VSPSHPAGIVAAARRLVRRDGWIAVAAVCLAVLPLAFFVAWLMAGWSIWSAPGPAPLVLVTCALVAGVLLFAAAVRAWLRGLDESRVAAGAEAGLGLPAGSVRGVLELGRDVPAGTSAALARRAELEMSRRLAGRPVRLVAGELGRRAAQRRVAAVAGLVALSAAAAAVGLVSPRRSQAALSPLLNPIAHLTPPPLPALEVRPGDAEVLRGGAVTVRVRAEGRAAITIAHRADGDVLRRTTVRVLAGEAEAELDRIDAPTTYWAEALDGARSASYRLTPVDPLLVAELVIDATFPGYLGRAPERFEGEVPTLELPEGTRLAIRGRTTRPLRDAALVRADGRARIGLTADGARFSGTWTPAESATFAWALTGTGGTVPAEPPAPLTIVLAADAPPHVEITYPAADTTFDAGMVQPVLADARDDHGVAAASLISWRVSAAGRSDPRHENTIGIGAVADRLLLEGLLDAGDRGLLPGDTLRYLVRVTDTRGQTGDSRVHALWLPSLAQLRERAERDARETVSRADALTRAMTDLERQTRELQRRTAAANARNAATRADPAGASAGGRAGLDFEQTEQGRQVLRQQEELLERLEELRDRLAAMSRAAERAGLQDAEMLARMQELRELYDRLTTPEHQQQLEQLRRALDDGDARRMEESLEQLAARQDELRRQLERSLETLRRAAAEQEMNALAQGARELSTRQHALAEAMRTEPGPERGRQQEQLERQARDLEQALRELGQRLEQQGEAGAASESKAGAAETQTARRDMQEAARRAAEGRGEEAGAAGDRAAERLEDVARSLDAAREDMARAWRQEIQEGMQRATSEALSLARQQQDLLERMQRAEQETAGQGTQPAQQGQQRADTRAGQGRDDSGRAGVQPPNPARQQGQQSQQSQAGGAQRQDQQGGQQGQQGEQGRRGQDGTQGPQGQAGQTGDGGGMQSEQRTLQQGLEQLGRNLAQTGDRTGMVNRDVGTALGRANLNMQQTMQGFEEGRIPTQEAAQSVEALNRLALALLNNAAQLEQDRAGAPEQLMQELAELARQQGSLSGQSASLLPLGLSEQAMAQQAGRLGQEQQEIATRLEGLSRQGGQEDVLGRLDALAKEAYELARQLVGGRLSAEVASRQERLFHRLLDAGRTLEKDEYSEERVGERARPGTPSRAGALDPSLIDAALRYRVPTPEELSGLPPAYRRWILEYFERLNRSVPPEGRERP